MSIQYHWHLSYSLDKVLGKCKDTSNSLATLNWPRFFPRPISETNGLVTHSKTGQFSVDTFCLFLCKPNLQETKSDLERISASSVWPNHNALFPLPVWFFVSDSYIFFIFFGLYVIYRCSYCFQFQFSFRSHWVLYPFVSDIGKKIGKKKSDG